MLQCYGSLSMAHSPKFHRYMCPVYCITISPHDGKTHSFQYRQSMFHVDWHIHSHSVTNGEYFITTCRPACWRTFSELLWRIMRQFISGTFHNKCYDVLRHNSQLLKIKLYGNCHPVWHTSQLVVITVELTTNVLCIKENSTFFVDAKDLFV